MDKILLGIKMQLAFSGTSAATCKLMKPSNKLEAELAVFLQVFFTRQIFFELKTTFLYLPIKLLLL